MNRHRTIAALAASALLAAAAPTALGGDIYAWTDENGVVHYGDRPSGAASERVVHVVTQRGEAPRTQPSTPARAPAANPTAATAAEEGPTEEELRAQAQERAEKCEMFKQRLQTYLTARRLYREDESGERVYLSDDEILAARARVQEQIVEYCQN